MKLHFYFTATLLLISLLFVHCRSEKVGRDMIAKEIEKLSLSEISYLNRNKQVDFSLFTVLDNELGIGRDEAYKCAMSKQFGCEYYLRPDSSGYVKIVEYSSENNIIKAIITSNAVGVSSMEYFKTINCDSIKSVLEEMREIFPKVVFEGVELKEDNYLEVRRQLLVSVFESCGSMTFDNLDKRDQYLLFMEYQHASPEITANYFHLVSDAYSRGVLVGQFYALALDRVLSFAGFKQVYGSQIFNGEWVPVENEQILDSLRINFGMEPIDTYLERFSLKR